MSTPARMPAFYLPHGAGPCFFMDWTWGPANTWDALRHWLESVRSTLPGTPRAIVVVSAHWECPGFAVGAHPQPPLIYDYSGFPPHTYQLPYAAAGAPELAARLCAALQAHGLPSELDPQRGLDHGVFVPLKLMFPAADIPVIPLALQQGLDPARHLAAGAALDALRDEGVLLLGSGMSWHNMRGFSPAYTERSRQFDAALHAALCQSDRAARYAALLAWSSLPEARTAHPRAEHLLPLMLVMGSARAGEAVQRVFAGEVMDVAVSAWRVG